MIFSLGMDAVTIHYHVHCSGRLVALVRCCISPSCDALPDSASTSEMMETTTKCHNKRNEKKKRRRDQDTRLYSYMGNHYANEPGFGSPAIGGEGAGAANAPYITTQYGLRGCLPRSPPPFLLCRRQRRQDCLGSAMPYDFSCCYDVTS